MILVLGFRIFHVLPKNYNMFYELWRENVQYGVTLTAIFKLTQNVQTVMQTHTKVDNLTNFVLK